MTDTDFHTDEATETHLDFGTEPEAESPGAVEGEQPASKPAAKKRVPRKRSRKATAAAGSPRQIIEKFQEISELDEITRTDISAVAGMKEITDDPVDITEAITSDTIDTLATEQAIALIQDVQNDPVTVGMTLMGMGRAERAGIWKALTQVGAAEGALKGSDMEASSELHKVLAAATDDRAERLFTALEIIRG